MTVSRTVSTGTSSGTLKAGSSTGISEHSQCSGRERGGGRRIYGAEWWKLGRPPAGWVAVGMPVTRHPPHRPVLALLTHTVLTSDIGRQTAHSATGVEPRPGGVWHQVAPENESTSIGSSGSAGVSGGTTNEAPHYGTPSFAPGCPVRRDIGNIREPPIGATSGSPRSIRASVFAVSAEYPSAWPPCVCRSSCELP